MQTQHTSCPPWLKAVLVVAGVYNLVWGAMVIVFPGMLFSIMDLPEPIYPAIWQCVGMIVGVYGIGYLIAARDPLRHWPIVLVGLLGKVFGPIGFVYAAFIVDELPSRFIWVIIPNDLIWWVPFLMILVLSAKHAQSANTSTSVVSFEDAIESHPDQSGVSIAQRSEEKPIMLVFLRHLGCTFCMETLQDLRAKRDQIEARGIEPVLVHMSEDDAARTQFASYGLDDLPRIADPDQDLYRAFELHRGSLLELMGPRVWVAGLRAMLRGNTIGGLKGDGFQMPGVFVVHKGRIVRSFRHKGAGDRPAYESMACEIPSP